MASSYEPDVPTVGVGIAETVHDRDEAIDLGAMAPSQVEPAERRGQAAERAGAMASTGTNRGRPTRRHQT